MQRESELKAWLQHQNKLKGPYLFQGDWHGLMATTQLHIKKIKNNTVRKFTVTSVWNTGETCDTHTKSRMKSPASKIKYYVLFYELQKTIWW